MVLPLFGTSQILQFHFVNPTRAEDQVESMMAHVISEGENQAASTGDQLYYFITGLKEKCEGYSLDDCRRCAQVVQNNRPFSRDLKYHWARASAMFNEWDFIQPGPVDEALWKYDRVEWHFHYGGNDLADAQEDKYLIDPLLRIAGTRISDDNNRIFIHVPFGHEQSTKEAITNSLVLNEGYPVSVKPY